MISLCEVLSTDLSALFWRSWRLGGEMGAFLRQPCQSLLPLLVLPLHTQKQDKSEPFMLYRSLLRPLLFRLPPETAHELALHSLSFAPNLTKALFGDRFKRSP